MITLGEEHKLGRKAYWLLMWKNSTSGLTCLLITFLVLILRSFIVSNILKIVDSIGFSVKAGMITSYIDGAILILFVISLFVCLINILVARLTYVNHTFTMEEFDLRIKQGIVNIEELSIPYRSMQDINIERNVLHQFTGTARVVIDSAGHEEQDSHNETDIILDPIDHELAEEIRVTLQRKIGVQVIQTEDVVDKRTS